MKARNIKTSSERGVHAALRRMADERLARFGAHAFVFVEAA
jgi:hypothetical protein